MELGRRAEYALRAAVHLARRDADGSPRKGRMIAEATGVPPQYLPQVLAGLVRAGLVRSAPGPRGGYALTRAPETISLLDVIEAVDGPLASAVCPLRGVHCGGSEPCGLHADWRAAQELARAGLGAATLAQVAAREDSAAAPRRSTPP